MDDRRWSMWFLPFSGFLVVVAFGVGVIATAAYHGRNPFGSSPPAGAVAQPQVMEIELGDFFIKPADIQAPPGRVTLQVHNSGRTEHNFAVGGVSATDMIAPGDTATLTVDLEPGTYEVFCEVPGHAEGGMRGSLTVGGGASTPVPSQGPGSMAGMTAEEMMAHDADRSARFPAKTKGRGGVPLEPEVLPDGTKRFELVADEIQWETEPGVVKQGMAYNGMIPGPEIRVDLGDRVEIVLRNELEQPTTLHLHGMVLPNGMDGVPAITQDAIMPGGSFTYRFTVRNPGSNMYHSHFNAVEQVPAGLLGAFIVNDPADPKVDGDHVIVLNDGPLGFTLNGKSFPATQPIVARKGDVVRIRYMNEGLQIHPMHLHGMPQQVIAKDGHRLEQPYLADTLLVGPGERYDVLVEATEPGAWAFHCHVLSHAEGPDGMFGMVTALIVR